MPAFISDSMYIQVMDLRGGNFYTNTAAFNKEEWEKQGAEVYEELELFFTSMEKHGLKYGDFSF